MSLNGSILSVSGQSSVFTESILEESTLDNVNLSKLHLSQIITNESTIQDTQDLSHVQPATSSLSITIDQEEMQNARKHAETSNKNDSVMDITQPNIVRKSYVNSSIVVITEVMNSTKKSSKDIVWKNNNIEKDDSVVPVDEEDDEVEEISTLENAEETLQSVQRDMFSHLQPNKTTQPEKLHKTIHYAEIQESFIEQSHMEQSRVDEELKTTEPEKLQEGIEDYHMEQCHMEQHLVDVVLKTDETDLFQFPFVEIGRRLWPSNVKKQHYTKGCSWSPDGTCLLVPVHLDGMHVVELPIDLYNMQELNPDRNLSDLSSAVHVKEGGTVYDFCWYPFMNSTDPATCCWLATRQHEPIHMWDAFTGELRCSYRGYDDVDEVESAISIIFSNDAQKVIGGFKKTIKIFDTNIPGRNCFTIPVKQAVSCFGLTTDNDNCVTAGTWSGYINHYDLRAPKLGPLFTLGGHTGGITWLKYSPAQNNGWFLFSGARRDNKILQWDMRNYTEPIQIFERNVQTNQRIYFDLSPLHKWLATGDTKGLLRIWNLENKEQNFEIPFHTDCCNGVSFHPSLPILSTTSGQYHFVDVTADENTKNSDTPVEKVVDYENSLLFLWFGSNMIND